MQVVKVRHLETGQGSQSGHTAQPGSEQPRGGAGLSRGLPEGGIFFPRKNRQVEGCAHKGPEVTLCTPGSENRKAWDGGGVVAREEVSEALAFLCPASHLFLQGFTSTFLPLMLSLVALYTQGPEGWGRGVRFGMHR